MAAQIMKENDWDNILTAHQGESAARTWSWSTKKLGRFMLSTKDGSIVKSVGISFCGNYGFVGSNNGSVYMYNMQSGIHRRSFINGHTKAVTACVADELSVTLISTSLDGNIKVSAML
jgi:U3 small nucleolar RNA-associated protein 21